MRKQEGRDFPREKSDTLWRLFRSKKSLILLAAVIVAVCVLLIWNTLSLPGDYPSDGNVCQQCGAPAGL